MTHRDARALRASLDARLLNLSMQTGRDVGRLRRHLTFQRILARLALDERWVLKGGFALEVRLVRAARATRDLDLAVLRGDSLEGRSLQDELDEALDVVVDHDGFTFLVGAPRPLAPDAAGTSAWATTVTAQLAGKPFQAVHVDVVLSADDIGDSVERLNIPPVVAGVGLEPASVLAVDIAQHAAEKLHALSRRYAGDRPSTRVKDLVDLVLLVESGLLPDPRLAARLWRVYQVRDGGPPPSRPSDPPTAWQAEYARLAADLDLDARSLGEAMAVVVATYPRETPP